jgi:hypothetical protein
MRFLWPLLLGLIRPLYLAYAWWSRLFPVAVLLGLCWLLFWREVERWSGLVWLLTCGYGALAARSIWVAWQQGHHQHPNPWQSAFMAWFGSLKLFSTRGDGHAVQPQWPSRYLVENPHGYRIGGPQARAILNQLQSGDILLRGYEGYIDGVFIRQSSLSAGSGFRAGWFTHAALYVGPIDPSDQQLVEAPFRAQEAFFSPGPQQVIHAMARGVHCEDILTFLRCDYLCVLRLPPQIQAQPGAAQPWQAGPAPLSSGEALHRQLLEQLQAGQPLAREAVVQAARQSALEKIGKAYDFDCSDTKAFSRFSCAELVYYCLRGVLGAIGLQAQPHALYPFAPAWPQLRMLERSTITPDDIHDLARTSGLHCVWIDAVSAQKTGVQARPN